MMNVKMKKQSRVSSPLDQWFSIFSELRNGKRAVEFSGIGPLFISNLANFWHL
jgi:hypothetical protein